MTPAAWIQAPKQISFPILSIPIDVRLKIYEAVFAGTEVYYTTSHYVEHRYDTPELTCRIVRTSALLYPTIDTSILWTCHSIYEEAKPVLHATATLEMTRFTFIPKCHPFYVNTRSFRNIHLAEPPGRTGSDYLPSQKFDTIRIKAVLEAFPHTKTLTTYMRSNPIILDRTETKRVNNFGDLTVSRVMPEFWKTESLEAAMGPVKTLTQDGVIAKDCDAVFSVAFVIVRETDLIGRTGPCLIGVSSPPSNQVLWLNANLLIVVWKA